MSEGQNSSDDRQFELGMEILARLESEIWAGEDSGPAENHPPDPERYPRRPSLHSILADLEPLSTPSVLIGVCEDGLPVLVDLARPQVNSLLVLGGPRSGKTALLLSALASACLINPPRKVRFACIGRTLAELDPILSEPHCYRFCDPTDDLAAEIVHELADLAEQRALCKDTGPVVILAIDDLQETLETLDEASARRLLWLIAHGPASQVWTLATLDASQKDAADLLRRFKTWLVGGIDLEQQVHLPDRLRAAHPEQLALGDQFCAYFENEWIRFWVPQP